LWLGALKAGRNYHVSRWPDAIYHSFEMVRKSGALSKSMPANLFVINPRACLRASKGKFIWMEVFPSVCLTKESLFQRLSEHEQL